MRGVKPDIQSIAAQCPDVPEAFVRQHAERLESDYFERFDPDRVAEHIRHLHALSSDRPFVMTTEPAAPGHLDCTLLAFDYDGLFSLVCGIFAGMGLSIHTGEIFTYARRASPTLRELQRTRRRHASAERRRVIDHFAGHYQADLPAGLWIEELERRLTEVLGLLEQGDESSHETARSRVNEWVIRRLGRETHAFSPVLYPVEIEVEPDRGGRTELRVISQDTPAFLYTLTNALALQGLLIERVRIRTVMDQVEDHIEVVDASGHAVTEPDHIDRIKWSVLLTKQFTYYLDTAPDPYRALSRFEHIVRDAVRRPDVENWAAMLSDPDAMRDLAHVLGASDFLWEDFIRSQYEQLLPMLQPHVKGHRFSTLPDVLAKHLDEALAQAADLSARKQIINECKNREIFLIDLDHILDPTTDFQALGERLTALAELIVDRSASVVYAHRAERHGVPRTVAGLDVPYTILGLGKMGGAALGYASDIELMFVYSDSGRTDGPEPLDNGEFFTRMVKDVAGFIETKREGIFRIDLRLRPHGRDGPQGVSLESFIKYYGPGGPAHSYERLALVRLRTVGGDRGLGRRIERLRDEFIYTTRSIVPEELRALREKQFHEKSRPGVYNAKFSPGALVDVEYSVQLLQVMSGGDNETLRSPRIHRALEGLADGGILDEDEADQLRDAYDFLRRLINSLRMLRGSAEDLFLPPEDAPEFLHLARRMGYRSRNDFSPARQLYVEFETQTAVVRTFVEKHLGRDSLPGPESGNVADLLLADTAPEPRTAILEQYGFRDTRRAYDNLRRLAGRGARRDLFVKLAVLACDQLSREPNPDMALNNWERFTQAMGRPEAQYNLLFAQPRRFEILLGIFARSQFLADTLIRSPEFFEWATTPDILYRERKRDALAAELSDLSAAEPEHDTWLKALCKYRRRELLRIGTRDMCLHLPLAEITRDISALADAVIEAALDRAWSDTLRAHPDAAEPGDPQEQFCVFAFGKLGGYELNYSSDIDLMGVCGDVSAPRKALTVRVMEQLRADLSRHTAEGHAYRVDLRLRPYGRSGDLVPSVDQVLTYYRDTAELWEIQALLKLRPVAGSRIVGDRLRDGLTALIRRPRAAADIFSAIRRLREAAIEQLEHRGAEKMDVKSGVGGIRDIEFLVQGLQLLHADERPEILSGNTIEALRRLREAHLLSDSVCDTLSDDYVFLRSVEHFLQILEDRQIHRLPEDDAEMEALAKRALDIRAGAADLRAELARRQERVRTVCEDVIKNNDFAGNE